MARDVIDVRAPREFLYLYPPLWPPQDVPEQVERRARARTDAKDALDRFYAEGRKMHPRDAEFHERQMLGRSCPWAPDPTTVARMAT